MTVFPLTDCVIEPESLGEYADLALSLADSPPVLDFQYWAPFHPEYFPFLGGSAFPDVWTSEPLIVWESAS